MKILVAPDPEALPLPLRVALSSELIDPRDYPKINEYLFRAVGKRFTLRGVGDCGEILSARMGGYDDVQRMHLPRLSVLIDWDREAEVTERIEERERLRTARREVELKIRDLVRRGVAATTEGQEGAELVDVKIAEDLSVEVLSTDRAETEALALSLREMIEAGNREAQAA